MIAGSCDLVVSYAAIVDGRKVFCEARQRVTSLPPPLLPDYDRDMKADEKDALDMRNNRLLYFWSNRDTWQGDDAFDRYHWYHAWPKTFDGNAEEDKKVNGRNDLVNLCPFTVRLADLVREWGTDGVKYKLYTGYPDDVRFTFVDAKWKNLDALVKEGHKTVFNEDLHSAKLRTTSRGGWLSPKPMDEVGYELPKTLLDLGEKKSGVLAVEFATEGTRTIRLVAEDETGAELFSTSVRVRVLNVHNMYRWLNLDNACGVTNTTTYASMTDVQWPDSEHADANVVFVHGYNVHPSEARGWAQTMFKRLWWCGMDAGFTAVLWRGNESQIWVPVKAVYATINYHQNVLNAFITAPSFARDVNNLPGAKKYMIAHSLGNMLVSAARQFHGLKYEKYLMLNAAVPIEAYDRAGGITAESKRIMTPPEWRPYPDRVRATHWHELPWPAGDPRRDFTWKDIFRDVDNTVNFYSTKDEVVANGNDEVKNVLTRDFAWYNQDRKKGALLVSLSPQAGWKFNLHYQKEVKGYDSHGNPEYWTRLYKPEETAEITDAELMERPFFRDFRDNGENGGALVSGGAYQRWYALSHGIPVESFATGANPVPKWGAPALTRNSKARNVNMAVICKPEGKKPDDVDPGNDEEDDNNSETSVAGADESVETLEERKEVNWVHSYFIQMSLFDTKILYEMLVSHIGSTIPEETKKDGGS